MNRDEQLRRIEERMAETRDEMARLTARLRSSTASPAIPLLTPEGTVWQITTLEEPPA